ncbi:MAG: GGDEF domain-containing protein, partial [Nitrospiria bacterium]
RLLLFKWVNIVGVVDLYPKAPGFILAKKEGLPVFIEAYLKILKRMDVDLVFDVTGDPNVEKELLNISNRSFEVATGEVTKILWDVIQELEQKEEKIKWQLEKHRILSEISLMLSSSNTPDEVFDAIVRGVIRLTGMPAGSLSVFNKKKRELYLVSAKGFSSEFYKKAVYPVRPGGLTEHILSQNKPILIPDISDFPNFNNPIVLREGIRSLIAIPLISEKGPIGILYNDDFKPRILESSMVETLRVLATQAVIAIQKQQAFEQIKNLSIHDPLTGIYNRRYLNKALKAEMDRALRLKHPLSIILIDIDNFKLINDQFGHLVGDQVLQDLVKLFETIIRPYDIFTRFGGEEFLIMLAESDEQKAIVLSERLRAATAKTKLSQKKIAMTCSLGVSTFWWEEEPLPSLEMVVERADKALYQAKGAGRNRTRVFDSKKNAITTPPKSLPPPPRRRKNRSR